MPLGHQDETQRIAYNVGLCWAGMRSAGYLLVCISTAQVFPELEVLPHSWMLSYSHGRS